MLLAPVISGGRPVGVLMLFREGDSRWKRAEVSRARVVGYALAPLLVEPVTPALTVVPAPAVDSSS
jgi:hypothetical protein